MSDSGQTKQYAAPPPERLARLANAGQIATINAWWAAATPIQRVQYGMMLAQNPDSFILAAAAAWPPALALHPAHLVL